MQLNNPKWPGSTPEPQPPQQLSLPSFPEPSIRTATPDQLASMRKIQGVYWDPVSGYAFKEMPNGYGQMTPFSFEDANWSGPFMRALLIINPFGVWTLNPFDFATHDTGVLILNWVRKVLEPFQVVISLDETQNIAGPYTRTIQRRIRVGDVLGNSEQLNAGRLAMSRIINPDEVAASSLRAELYEAGVLAHK